MEVEKSTFCYLIGLKQAENSDPDTWNPRPTCIGFEPHLDDGPDGLADQVEDILEQEDMSPNHHMVLDIQLLSQMSYLLNSVMVELTEKPDGASIN